jgi:glycosyltransferase involved in cell wall biosynthesis
MGGRLRLLHVTPYYRDAWAYGGIPRVATVLTETLSRRGHHVTVCTTDARDGVARLSPADGSRGRATPWPVHRTEAGVDLRVFPNVSNRLAHRWQLFWPVGLASYLRRHAGDFDVAHLHAYHNLPGALAARQLRRGGVPYVLAPNGTAPWRLGRLRLAKRLFDATLGRSTIPGAAGVLAVSDAEARQLAALGVNHHAIHVVPNPMDLSEFDNPPPRGWLRERLGVGTEPIVLYLGTLTPRKRIDVLVAAIARLPSPRPRLIIAGDDLGSGPVLRRLVHRLGLETVTSFTGLLRGRDRLRALADADVVVYASEHEVFGLVPLEALLVGTPVIVADDSGCGEIVADVGGGLLVPPGDRDALAAAIARVLESRPAWSEHVAAAAARIRRRFAPDAISDQLESIYRAVLPSQTAVQVDA